ncbi:MAG: MOSC N-terminal beta barrel domain-containing protein [Burkholderiaceae bacterium]|jgi:uncharacterized protein YcbX|nr:MOSC N-terminal beta barrel domain-containing protein [Burkholderiaceae bacterium]
MSQSSFIDGEVQARVAGLSIYPVKSCAGVALNEAPLGPTGLALDRAWMVVDAQGAFLTQREWPRMVLVRPQVGAQRLTLNAPDMPPLQVPLEPTEKKALRVRIWKDTVDAWDAGDAAAQWFSAFLQKPGLRLARFNPAVRRLSNLEWTRGVEAVNQFADGYPLLVLSQAAVTELNQRLRSADSAQPPVTAARLRPNLVLSDIEAHDEDRLSEMRIVTQEGGGVRLKLVKPCTRCPIPGIDPDTAAHDPRVWAALAAYRADPRVNGALTFGMNAIILEGAGQILRVGDHVSADWNF